MRMRTIGTGTVLAVAMILGSGGASLLAQAPQQVRIATGSPTGTYHATGELMAQSIASASGVTVVAVPSKGSVENVQAVAAGQAETALSQADVAYWAYSGTGEFEGKPPANELRAIGHLYPESIHLVVRKGAGVQEVGELRNKRVSLDEQGSGTLAEARLVLDAWGLKESDLRAEHLTVDAAAQRLKDGTLDAFFYVGGFPVPAIVELAKSTAIELAPIDGPRAEKLRGSYKFLSKDEIPDDVYKGVVATRTLSVGAQWITSSKLDAEAVYRLTKALWSDATAQALEAGHPKGKLIRRDNALHGVGIPLHPGAERFYKEAGLIN
jgi:hypothetical protein